MIPDQDADFDPRSADTQKSKPSEVVFPNVAAGNCMHDQTSASQLERVAEEDHRTTQNSVVVVSISLQVNSDEYTRAI